jgi:hypothetical protein
MPKAKLLSAAEFAQLRPKLRQRLLEALKKELSDCAIPELGGESDSDLWDLPPVDSKTVVKLSPIVEELTQHKLQPTWIKKGGYPSEEIAVDDLLTHIALHCVVNTPAAAPATTEAVTS